MAFEIRSPSVTPPDQRPQAMIPSFLAFAVIGLMERHYPRLIDYDFTASMENELDEIAGGDHAAVDFLTSCYFGSTNGTGDQAIAHAGGLKKLVTENLSAMGAWVDVSPGDYFELKFNGAIACTTDISLNSCWFCLECQ